MKDLDEIRKEINEIDENMCELFVRRLAVSAEVAEAKRASGTPILNPAREREILARVAKEVGPDMENEARLFFTTLFSISRGRQRTAIQGENGLVAQIGDAIKNTPDQFPSSATVACPGTEGAYSHWLMLWDLQLGRDGRFDVPLPGSHHPRLSLKFLPIPSSSSLL